MNILLTGASGFIGQALSDYFLSKGYGVTGVSRSLRASVNGMRWVSWSDVDRAVAESDIVINLAGESVFGSLWSEKVKKSILESRTRATSALTEAIAKEPGRVSLFISASAVGVYGDCGDRAVDESSPEGSGFLAEVCKAWETAALEAAGKIPVSICRIGVVLEKDGGALEKMIPQFRLFLGGPAGGAQYVPWIHRLDLIRAMEFVIEQKLSGIWNASAPYPVTMGEFAATLGTVMHRPSFFQAPPFLLKMVLGEASEALLQSAKVLPKKLENAGFRFRYEHLKPALQSIISK